MSALYRKTQLCESSPTLVRRPLTFADTTVSRGTWTWLERVCRGGLFLGVILVRARGRGPFAWRESSLFLPFFLFPAGVPKGRWGLEVCGVGLPVCASLCQDSPQDGFLPGVG